MYNIAIVGLGHIAAHQVAALNESEIFNLVAVCDTDPEQLALYGAGRMALSDLSELLHIPDIDVIVISTPNRLHAEHGVQVLEKGKWLMIEKPLAETWEDFTKVEEARDRCDGHCTLALHAAFGQEVEWYCENQENLSIDPARLEWFFAQFYDPYFQDGRIQSRALSLGGSWLDSGINALSVISRLIGPGRLTINDSRMTRVDGSNCAEVQGSVDFNITVRENYLASGLIDTNWTLGRDSKSTLLAYHGSDRKILLDHSKQEVRAISVEGEEVLFTCSNGRDRLTNHYIGVFESLAQQMDAGEDNFDYCKSLHRLLFKAEDGLSSE